MFSGKRKTFNKKICEDELIKDIIREIKDKYKYSLHSDNIKNQNKQKTLARNRSNFSTINIKKSYVPLKNQNSLINNLQYKITKESLIIELREELKYHLKFNLIYKNFLSKVIKLKDVVKENKEKVEENAKLLREAFKDRFNIVDQYEKTISLLNIEKKDIIKANKDIIKMRENTNRELQKQFNEVTDQTNEQRIKIEEIGKKLSLLQYKKDHIEEELQSQLNKEEINYDDHLKEYKTLINKYEYFLEEYNSYDKTGNEIAKQEVKLFDNTKVKNMLIEEDLNIKLNEKLLKRNNLMNKKNKIQNEIKMLEEKIREQQLIEEKKKLSKKVPSFRTKLSNSLSNLKSTKNKKY